VVVLEEGERGPFCSWARCKVFCPLVSSGKVRRDWYFIAEQQAPAPHLAHPGGCAALRIVLVTVPRVSRSCEHFPDGFDLHLLQGEYKSRCGGGKKGRGVHYVAGPAAGFSFLWFPGKVRIKGATSPFVSLNSRLERNKEEEEEEQSISPSARLLCPWELLQTLIGRPYIGLCPLRSMSPYHHSGTPFIGFSQNGVAGARASDGQ